MIYVAVLLLNVAGAVSAELGPNCLSCTAVALPEQCHHVVRCSEGQQCYTQRILHDSKGVFYKLGCMTLQACKFYNTHSHDADVGKRQEADFLKCSQCCQDHFCNHKMCAVTNASEDFLNCMECGPTIDPSNECKTIRTCAKGQNCYVKLVEAVPGNKDFVFEMGCWSLAECNNETQIFSNDGCIQCGNSSYSNMHACDDYLSTQTVST